MTVRTIEAQPVEKKSSVWLRTAVSVPIMTTNAKVWKHRKHIMKRGSGCIPNGSARVYSMISGITGTKADVRDGLQALCTNAASGASTMC